MSKLQIVHHAQCFDGAMSAALFAAFYRRQIDPRADIAYRGMGHRRGDPYGDDHDALFEADENAVVDFRYSPSPRLTWWCDHHESAFIEPEHRSHFETHPSPQKCFDPAAPSCAGLLGRWLAQQHGFDAAAYADHLYWADLIDAARFESPAQAVRLAEPALKLMALLESGPGDVLTQEIIEGLADTSVAATCALPDVQRALQPVLERHAEVTELVRSRLELRNGVVAFDLSGDDVASFNKFIPYSVYPEARYTVGLTCTADKAKLSVGSNPWRRPEPLINLAELCARYGGGGHAVVAGASFPPSELAAARRAAAEISAVLRGERPY